MACLLVACHQIGHTGILSFVIGVDINSRLSIHSSLVEGGSIRGPIVVIFSLLIFVGLVFVGGFLLVVGVRTHNPLSSVFHVVKC